MSKLNVEDLESYINELRKNLGRNYALLRVLREETSEFSNNLPNADYYEAEKLFERIEDVLYYVFLSMEDSKKIICNHESTLQDISYDYSYC